MNFVTNPPKLVLETERLRLRPMAVQDADLIVHWRNLEHIASMSPKTTKALTVKGHLDWFSATRSRRVDYIIELKDPGRPIGSVSWEFRKFEDDRTGVESGRYIGETDVLGKGYAMEAARVWLDFAFETLQVDCAFTRHRPENLAPIKINEKLGFKIEPWPTEFGANELGLTYMYLSKNDWDNRRNSQPGKCA